MSTEQLALTAIVILCCCYFAVPDRDPNKVPGRDLRKEHALGAHRETAAWGCPLCEHKRP